MSKTTTKKTSRIRPVGDRILVKMAEDKEGERRLDSGIILPSSVKGTQESTKRGEVIAIGPGKYDEGELNPIVGINPGDIVLFSWGDQMTIDDIEYYLVTESNILGVIEKD